MDKRTPEKKERLLNALDRGMAMIHLDARRPGVLVPEHLRGEPQLLLNLSYRFDPPDLAVGEWGIRSTLTFSGRRFTIAVPWSALYAISSHVSKEFWMYPDDMPPELIEQTQLTAKATLAEMTGKTANPPGPGTEPIETSRGLLREVVADKKDGEGPNEDPPKPRQRGHLRVVK
jgi:stringent starvation protein B